MTVQTSHQPIIRARPAEWLGFREELGSWQWRGVTGTYELVCPACGDDGGPLENQSDAVRQVRGTFRNPREAERAAISHMISTS